MRFAHRLIAWLLCLSLPAALTPLPVAYQDLETVDLNWGYGSPSPAVPVDYFSATFERTYNFPLINGWTDGPHDISNALRNVGPGAHTVTVDYYDRGGYAYLELFWYADQFGPSYAP